MTLAMQKPTWRSERLPLRWFFDNEAARSQNVIDALEDPAVGLVVAVSVAAGHGGRAPVPLPTPPTARRF